MKIVKKAKKKYGLMISVELIIAMIIISSLVTIVGIAGKSMLDSAKISRISADLSTYKDSMKNFYELYGYFAGDVVANNNFVKLSTGAVNANITKVEQSCSGNECKMGNGILNERKAILTFQQLAASGFLSNQVIDTGFALNASGILNTVAQNYFTAIDAKFLPGLRGFSNATVLPIIKNENGKNVLYMVAFGAKNYHGGGEFLVASPNVSNGAISATILNELDFKIDDGSPLTGIVRAENGAIASEVQSSKCVNLGVYTDSSVNNNPAESCRLLYVSDNFSFV